MRKPTPEVVLKALEISYFKNLEENPLMVYQSLDDLLPSVNKYLTSMGFKMLSIEELERIVDILHKKYWLSGFYRHPKVRGFPILIEFRKRIFTKGLEPEELNS